MHTVGKKKADTLSFSFFPFDPRIIDFCVFHLPLDLFLLVSFELLEFQVFFLYVYVCR
jgi:hypothetical protein